MTLPPVLNNTVHTIRTSLFLPTCVVFFIVFGIIAFIKLTDPFALTTFDDPYYHARYAAMLAQGIDVPPAPSPSTMGWFGGGTVYWAYHELFAVLISLTGVADDSNLLILVSKLYHAALTALFYTVFFIVAARLIRREVRERRTVLYGAALATIVLSISSVHFTFRTFMERPYLFGMFLTLVLIDALLHRAPLRIYVVAAMLALSYSFSVIALVPLGVYMLNEYVHKQASLFALLRTVVLPFFGGFGTGVLLHPHALYYLYNGLWVPFVVMFHSGLGTVIEAEELVGITLGIHAWLWFVFLSLLLICGYAWWREHDVEPSRTVTFFATAAGMLFVAATLIGRAVEYLIPVVVLGMCVLAPVLARRFADLCVTLLNAMSLVQKRTLIATACVYVFVASFMNVHKLQSFAGTYPFETYRELYSVLATETKAGDYVWVPLFHTFTLGYFFMPELTYSQGLDPSFTFLADERAYWLGHHALLHPDTICTRRTCSEAEYTLHEAVRNGIGARFIVIDYRADGTNRKKLVDNAEMFARFDGVEGFTPIFDRTVQGKRIVAYRVD